MELHVHRVSLHEHYIDGETPLHRADARVKTISTLILLFLIISTKHVALILLPPTIASLALLRFPLRKLSLPSTVIVTVFFIVLLTYGGEGVMWRWWIFSITEESFAFSITILTRVFASLGVVFTFLATTKTFDVLEALRWMKLPKTVIDLSYLMLRYVGLLSQEAERMYFAAKSKHAFSPDLPYSKKLGNLGMLAGSLLLRAIDRSERVYMGMLSKGYDGEIRYRKCRGLTFLDYTILTTIVVLAVLALHVDGVVL